jgi:hypothetical protein
MHRNSLSSLMANHQDVSTLLATNLTLSGADLPVASGLKEGANRISRRIFRGSTYYLTVNGADVEASLLNEKDTDQIVSPFNFFGGFSFSFTITIQWIVKPHVEIVGLYTISTFDDSDLSLTYDTSSNIVVDGITQYWNLDIRGDQFV